MQPVDLPGVMDSLQDEVLASVIRFPLAAALGAVLALRPQRRGTPERRQAVIQTQILLAVIGSFVMLIVGASLARAFGVAATASLIRYQAKVDNPKDAVVMLCALAAGLSCGVGLYALAIIGTLFVAVCLWIIEGFEQHTRVFELTIKLGDTTQALRPRIEAVLTRFKAVYELRTSAVEAASYLVTAPRSLKTDQVSQALREIAPDSGASIEWCEKSKAKLPK
jgi:uncharacterized membrane protein YhiD involved in acid resistance